MCGISGIYNLNNEPVSRSLLKDMTDVLLHRGPDDEGYILLNSGDGSSDIAFGHRRLSIIDLSSSGHQPMPNEDKSIWITYNGEVYNYIELREELEKAGHVFNSKTDTEVIIHAYEAWGEECLRRFNGMWAFAIWDFNKKRLFCARDRLGVKPFYYIYNKKQFAFASEIKSLLKTGIEKKPNDAIIFDYLAFGLQDHTEDTFFEGVKQLKPAHYLFLENGVLRKERYWNIEVNDEIGGKENDESRFYDLLRDSVRLRLRSDVPVGTCLSGGLDSSSIVCVMNKLIHDKKMQKTFSACSDNKKFDERRYIEDVIEETGAEKNYIFPGGANRTPIVPWKRLKTAPCLRSYL